MPIPGSRPASTPGPASAPGEPGGTGTAWYLRLWPGGLSDLATAIPLTVLLALFIIWAADRGGFPDTVWYPGALLALWLLVICLFDARYSLRLRDWRTAALFFFALFTAWSFLSMVWATVSGDAWEGANQTLLYLTVYAILSRWRTNVRIAGLFASLLALAVAAVGFVTIERALAGSHPASILYAWRLASPIDYPNGEAALFLIPLWPALFLVSRREVPPLARGLLAACASLLLQIAVLAQSRGSLYAFPIVFLVFLFLVNGRGRALAAALAVIAISALNLSRLLDVYQAGDQGRNMGQALARARDGMILPVVLLFLGATLVALVEQRIRLEEKLARRLDRGLVAAFGLALVLAAAIAVGSVGHPLRRVDSAWHNFQSGAQGDSSSSHFTSLFYGTHRYDFWRVAVIEFRRHPLAGVGANNFAVEYLRLRRTDEEPTNPHSLELKVLSQTGVVGALLFAGFLVSAFVATRRKTTDPLARGLAGSLTVAFAYWLVHGSVDWFWEMPVLAAVAFAFLGLAAALPAGEHGDEPQSGRRPHQALLVVPLALAVTISYAGPWLSARYVDAASRSWRADPQRAYDQLNRARSLDPLSDRPDLIAGTIAGRRLDYPRMRVAYRQALARNPLDWYAHFELGLADYLSGRRREALAQLERARQLDPREPVISKVIRRARGGRPIDLTAVNSAFLSRALGLARGTH